MRPITRQEALRLCKSHSVLVEVSIGGFKSKRALTPRSPLYLATGHFDFRNLRYYLVLPPTPSRGTGSSSLNKPGSGQSGQGTGTEDPPAEPREVDEAHETFSVRIMAENGKDPAPTEILPGTSVKLRAVPNKGGGKYEWKYNGKNLKLQDASSQLLTVSVAADAQYSQEKLELVFTPNGSGALGPVNHILSVVRVLFSEHEGHQWGFDAAGTPGCEDLNGRQWDFQTDESLDRISVESESIGLVNVYYKGLEGSRIFFKAKDASVCGLKPKDSGSNPIVLEVHAKGEVFKETRIEARIGSLSGPIAAELDLTVMKVKVYKAKYIRVVDPDSPKTKLTTKLGPKDLQKELNRLYSPGIATWEIIGEEKEFQSKYDIIKNGSLDLEPGVVSEEFKKLKSDCATDIVSVLHVHDLKWSFYLVTDAGAKDSKITLKNYGRFLDFIGQRIFTLEDKTGKTVEVLVKSVDVKSGEVTLNGPLGVDLKVSDKAALSWPLGGLSGNPTLVSDVGSKADLINYIAHELGHTLCGFADVAEVQNFMFGAFSQGESLRGRPIPKFYYPGKKEKQWSTMRGKA